MDKEIVFTIVAPHMIIAVMSNMISGWTGENEQCLQNCCSSSRQSRIHSLTSGLDVQEGKTALHYAAQFGETTIVKVLLNRGAFVDATDKVQT